MIAPKEARDANDRAGWVGAAWLGLGERNQFKISRQSDTAQTQTD